jgi:dUTP pyrophosphatase
MTVKIVNNSKHPSPSYATAGSAGMDLRANISSPITLSLGDRALIPTGLHIQLPEGHEAQIRPRSGLSLKHGVTCFLGTIDSDYTGEVGVILINFGLEDFVVNDGDRVAQMVIAKHECVEWDEVNELHATERGSGGFGHTGKG